MTTSNDPVSQIKKCEERARNDIESAKNDLEENLRTYEEDQDAKVKKFEKELKAKGTEKLETIKKEASELFKSKMATSENSISKIKGDSKSKKAEAIKAIISMFQEHVKK